MELHFTKSRTYLWVVIWKQWRLGLFGWWTSVSPSAHLLCWGSQLHTFNLKFGDLHTLRQFGNFLWFGIRFLSYDVGIFSFKPTVIATSLWVGTVFPWRDTNSTVRWWGLWRWTLDCLLGEDVDKNKCDRRGCPLPSGASHQAQWGSICLVA